MAWKGRDETELQGLYDEYRRMAIEGQKQARRRNSRYLLFVLIPFALWAASCLIFTSAGATPAAAWLGFLGTVSCFVLLIPMIILMNRDAKAIGAEIGGANPGFEAFFVQFQRWGAFSWPAGPLSQAKLDKFAKLIGYTQHN